MLTGLRVAGWTVFILGVVLIAISRSGSDFASFKWGALIACAGMILTYGSRLLHQARRSRTLPASMRRVRDASCAGEDGPNPPGASGPT